MKSEDGVSPHTSPLTPHAQQAFGLLGGTFDPIHYGHLRMAEELADALGLETVRFMPTATPPHRAQPAAPAAHRLAMVKLAIACNPRFVLDEHEAHKTEPCYLVDTLSALRAELGDAVPIVLFLGGDAFANLSGWHQWRRLFDLAHLAVARRPGEKGPEALPAELAGEFTARRTADPIELRSAPAGRIFIEAITQLDISASRIRQWLAVGSSPRYLLPDAVLEHIDHHRLYQ